MPKETRQDVWKLRNNNSRRDNKRERIKGAMEDQKLVLTLAANATQMQRNRIRGALTLPAIPLSHYPDAELTSLGSILVMPSARLDSNEYQFCKSLF